MTNTLLAPSVAGIHGDEPAPAYALRRSIRLLEDYPEVARGYCLFFYPVTNPTGFEHGSRESRRGRDLNREFWRESREPEVGLLERELREQAFHGIISLHSDDTPEAYTRVVDGIIESYELGFRMQDRVPELLDLSKEPPSVLEAYGVKPGRAGAFARQWLMARRLGIDLQVFNRAEVNLATRLGDSLALVLFTANVSHRACTPVLATTRARAIPVYQFHTSGVCALRKCLASLPRATARSPRRPSSLPSRRLPSRRVTLRCTTRRRTATVWQPFGLVHPAGHDPLAERSG